jgi:hypothetical protein
MAMEQMTLASLTGCRAAHSRRSMSSIKRGSTRRQETVQVRQTDRRRLASQRARAPIANPGHFQQGERSACQGRAANVRPLGGYRLISLTSGDVLSDRQLVSVRRLTTQATTGSRGSRWSDQRRGPRENPDDPACGSRFARGDSDPRRSNIGRSGQDLESHAYAKLAERRPLRNRQKPLQRAGAV